MNQELNQETESSCYLRLDVADGHAVSGRASFKLSIRHLLWLLALIAIFLTSGIGGLERALFDLLGIPPAVSQVDDGQGRHPAPPSAKHATQGQRPLSPPAAHVAQWRVPKSLHAPHRRAPQEGTCRGR